jgi:hypothetical protein
MIQCDVCPAPPFKLDSAANFCKCGAEYDYQGKIAKPTVRGPDTSRHPALFDVER